MGVINRTWAAVWGLGWRTRRLFARRSEPAAPPAPRITFLGSTAAGQNINPETALNNATVWACLRFLSQNVGMLPWRVFRREPNGDASAQPNHPADWILNVRPNPNMGSFAFRESLLVDAARWGMGYAEIERDAVGRMLALHYLESWRVTPRMRADGLLEFDVWNFGRPRTVLQQQDVFCLRGFGAGPVGLSIIEHAAQTIGWAQATELFGALYFGEGMNPAGIVETAAGMSPQALAKLKQEFKQLYKGVDKSHRTVFLDQGMKWTKVSANADESQFIETMQHQVETICRWFGVPPHKVMHLLRSTNNNIEHQSLEVVVDSVTPWVRRYEEEADYKCFGGSLVNRGNFFTRMDLSMLLRGDFNARANWYRTMWGIGVFSTNEIRRKEGENGIGPAGDKRVVPTNMTTIDKLGEEPAPQRIEPAPGDGGDDRTSETTEPTQPRRGNSRGKANGHQLPH